MKKVSIFIAAALLCAALFAGCSSTNAPLTPEKMQKQGTQW